YAIYKVKKRLEDLKLHNLIDTLDSSLRHTKNREFYDMNCQKAYDILSAIAQINGDEEQLIYNPYSDHYFEQSVFDGENIQDSQKQKQSRLKFSMIGIPIGSTLVFTKNPAITCITKNDDNKVEYNGVTYAISKLAAELLHISAAQGGSYFKYNGELLVDIRKRMGV
ncbi:MAG: GIY-YIG nuclease family protein, partial [Acutalibacteraceae bacterium]|nr:GIY-YIG nuclease family protein [Acutalibacteraceae bacterium]